MYITVKKNVYITLYKNVYITVVKEGVHQSEEERVQHKKKRVHDSE